MRRSAVSLSEETVLARVSWQYFIEGRNQASIAHEWGFSRSKVSRMLDKARRIGLVEISIRSPVAESMPVAERLKESLDLVWVAVVPDEGLTNEEVLDDIGRMAAAFLESRIDKLRVVGLGWGTTISRIRPFVDSRTRSSEDLPNLTFVELLGSFSSDGGYANSFRIAWPFSQAYGAKALLINAPAIATSSTAKEYFVQDPQIRHVLELGRSVDLAVVSVGSVDNNNTIYKLGYINDTVFQRVKDEGAVGDILGHFFDSSGTPVDGELEDRIVGVSFNDLRSIPVLAVAMGSNKVDGLLALAKSKTISHLITSHSTAELLLAQAEVYMKGGAKKSEPTPTQGWGAK